MLLCLGLIDMMVLAGMRRKIKKKAIEEKISTCRNAGNGKGYR